MIYTVTFNPALDYVVQVDGFTLGAVNRAVQEHMFYGGKGINVSAVLANLGYDSIALGFVAGFTGEELERGAKTLGFRSEFIHVKNGMTRINVKLNAQEETEINGRGPEIMPEDVDALFEKLDQLGCGDVLVLSGSIPSSIPDTVYEDMMERLEGRGIRVVVDATKDLLLNVLQYHPFLIKPNHHELGELFDVELRSEAQIIHYAGLLQERGAQNVLVSMAGDGAILLTEAGQVHRQKPPKGIVKNSVGAGDSMVAGFIAGYLKSGSYEEALKLGTAAGSASACSDGLAAGEAIRELYDRMGEDKMIRCCIFDLDGTLLNTLTALRITTNKMLGHFGYPEIGEEKIKRFVGDGYKRLVERALKDAGDTELVHYEEGLTVYMEMFAVHSMDEVKPYEGIVELLGVMKDRGIRLAVLSNKPHEQTVANIEEVFGAGYFDMVAGEQPGIPRKPDPAGVHRILEALGITPEQCLYFGDTDTDMKTGLGAGLTTVGVTWGFRDREELERFHPQYVVDLPEEVRKYVLLT